MALRAGDDERARKILDGIVKTTDGPTRDTAAYLLGKSSIETDPERAVTLLAGLPVPFGEAETRRRVWLARAQFASKKDRAGIATVDSIERAPERDSLRLERARALHRLGKVDDALAGLEGLDEPRLKAQALALKAAWLADSDPERAAAAARTLFIDHPAEPPALGKLPVTIADLDDKERFRRATRLMDAWEYAQARTEFRALVKNRRYAGRAKWNIAVISLRKLRDDPEEAEKILAQFLRRKRAKKREEAMYLMMRVHLVQERYDKVLALADQYDEEFPRGEYRERTAYYRGWLHYDRGDCKKALPGFKKYLKDRSHGKRSLVLGFRAWCYVRMGRWKWAYRAFGGLIPGGPMTEGKARYWRAVSLAELGRKDDGRKELAALRAKFPLTYYDMLGRQLEARWDGRDPRASALEWPKAAPRRPMPGPAAWDWPKLSESDAKAFALVRRMVELDEIDTARAAYKRIRSGVEAKVPAERRSDFLRFMGVQVEDYRHGWRVSTGSISNQEGLPDAANPRSYLAYPEAYKLLVERLAEEFGISAYYVYAIMRQESRYNPAAISWADAVGALQMIRPTARKVAADLGVTYDPETFPQPKISFRYSAHYLARHAKLFHGQLIPAAAAYNGGPSPIARWVRKYGDRGLAPMIEEFEYNESRIYCRQVASHVLRYLYLYERDEAVIDVILDALFPLTVNQQLPEDVGY